MELGMKRCLVDRIGDTIPIGDGTVFRLYCYDVWKYSSQWTVQIYRDHKFLWWKWSDWDILKYTLHYTIGPTSHQIEIKRKNETDEELLIIAKAELDFLSVDYE